MLMNIYHGAAGQNLMNPAFFTLNVSRYRAAERDLVMRLAAGFDLVTEVGCAEGMCAHDLTADGKRYVGLDVNASSIQRARIEHRGNEHVSFRQADFEQVVRSQLTEDAIPRGGLLVLPFNVFGNFSCPHGLLKAASAGYDALAVFTYAAGTNESAERLDYYERAGVAALKMEVSADGVCFSDGTGFKSMAFNEAWFLREFTAAGLEMHSIPVTSIGVLYCSFWPG